MWLTDRSRYLTGLAECQMKRYLQYHAGPYGYGYRRAAQSVPLATGTGVHAALATILQSKGDKTQPEVIRAAVRTAVEDYLALVTARGFQAGGSDDLVEEQACLIEGLVWGWCRTMLPVVLREFDVVEVEREETYVVGCSCGVVARVHAAHSPSCRGIVQMSRPDIVLRRRSDGKLGIHDFKTMGTISDDVVQQYRESVQMAVGTIGVEARIGKPVEHYYVHALIKGQYRREYNPDTREYDGPRRQASILTYLYRRPGNPPLYQSDWAPSFRYTVDGKARQLSRDYIKEPVWQQTFPESWPGSTAAEAWVRHLPETSLYPLFILIGPYQRQDFLIAQYLQSMEPHEQAWIDKLWRLFEAEQKLGWDSEEFQVLLAQEIPRSYNCWSYGQRCEMYDICFRQPGWTDPVGSGKYVYRRPHHEPELAQMRERGIPVPDEVPEEVAVEA